jgi:hypothetical protein
MSMIWTPDQVLVLTAVALTIALLVLGELREGRRERARLPVRAEEVPPRRRPVPAPEHRILRSLPRAARDAWQSRHLPATALRRASVD